MDRIPIRLRPGGRLAPLFIAAAVACSPGGEGTAASGDAAADTTPLTAEEIEKGVGPVRSVELGARPDPALSARGERLFRSRCVACHLMEGRSVGPSLGDVVGRRAPEYVMNMILNPAGMVARHPEARALKERFVTPMPDQGLSRDEARAVLEYLWAESRAPGRVE